MRTGKPINPETLLATAGGYLRDALRDMEVAQYSLRQDPKLAGHSAELDRLQRELDALIRRPVT